MEITRLGQGSVPADEHDLDFPGPVDSYNVKVWCPYHYKIGEFVDEYQRNGTIPNCEASHIALWIVNYASSAVLVDSGDDHATTLRFTAPEDADWFCRYFGGTV